MTGEFDPLSGKPPCPYTREDCLPECEHGYSGPCERNRLSYDEDRWMDITHVGSVHEIQWNPVTNQQRHRPFNLGPDGRQDRRWVDGKWIAGPPPGEKHEDEDDDDIDQRLESAMLTLERTVEEVSATVRDFRTTMDRLKRATTFLFCAFLLLGLCLIALGIAKLP